jgi:hypothetical protein
VRRELERIEIPGEHEARESALTLVRAAFAEREPAPQRGSWTPVLAATILLAALAALLSPPGRAVLDDLREAVGVEQAEPALFSLPSPGRLLVVSGSSTWSVRADGSKRLLGPYREAVWSPFGRFVVGATPLQLATLEPDGDKRWSLARPDVRLPAWGGTRADTRIAYLSGSRLHVVAGDGTGDRVVARGVATVAAAWLPRALHALTYATEDGRVITLSLQTGRELWRTARGTPVGRLEWSSDGRRLLVLRGGIVEIRDRTGSLATGIRPAKGRVTAAGFRPSSHAVAYVTFLAGRSRVDLVDEPSRTLFAGPGRIDQLAWSPDGSTLLVPWRDADQLLFIPRRTGRLRAVADISSQFEGFPRSLSWCCA